MTEVNNLIFPLPQGLQAPKLIYAKQKKDFFLRFALHKEKRRHYQIEYIYLWGIIAALSIDAFLIQFILSKQ